MPCCRLQEKSIVALAWQLNMQSLINTLEVAREEGVKKVFWPSSIAVFGMDAPKENCPQDAYAAPLSVYWISKLSGDWCLIIISTGMEWMFGASVIPA